MNPPDLHALPDDPLRALPHAVGPEKTVLSCILQDPQEFLGRAAEAGIRADHFYLPAHKTTFEAAQAFVDRHQMIDISLFVQHLLDNGLLDRCGGPAAIADLYTYAATTANFEHHAAAVIGKHVLRSIIQAANTSIAAAYDSPGEAWEALDEAERQILAIRDQNSPQAAETNRQAVDAILDEMQAIVTGRKERIGTPTGYESIDRMTGGLKPGQVFVIAARPSMGKSALMMNIIEHAVFTLEAPAMVFSLEMSRKELINRLMFSRAKFNFAAASDQKPNQGDLIRIKNAAIAITAAPLHIDDTPAITITELQAKARRAKNRLGIQLIAIDYLQLIRSTSRQASNSREREISEISAGVKAMAKELQIPVILLAQLNRDSEKRTGKNRGIPRMSDLRESGAIEQDADIIGLLHRAAYFADDEDTKSEAGGESRLIIAKNRSGATGDQHLVFIPELVRFENGYPPKRAPEPPKRRGRFDD